MSHTSYAETPSYWLSVSLLKEIAVTLHTSDGLSCRVPISPNAERLQLLAYLAWKRDQGVWEGEIFESLFFPRLVKEMMPEKISWSYQRFTKEERKLLRKKARGKFDDGKNLLRKNIRSVLTHVNAERDPALRLEEIDLFEQEVRRCWRLSSIWHVTDVKSIETYSRVIREAKEYKNTKSSDEVKAACDALIAAYPGDFLAQMLSTYPEEFQPRARSWVREPVSLFRESYLEALWYAGEYEWDHGRLSTNEQSWYYYERGAHLFRQYAMYACNSSWDKYIYFEKGVYGNGWHVLMSERAVCRCLNFYKVRAMRKDFLDTYHAYIQQMKRVSRNAWEPTDEICQLGQWVNE